MNLLRDVLEAANLSKWAGIAVFLAGVSKLAAAVGFGWIQFKDPLVFTSFWGTYDSSLSIWSLLIAPFILAVLIYCVAFVKELRRLRRGDRDQQ